MSAWPTSGRIALLLHTLLLAVIGDMHFFVPIPRTDVSSPLFLIVGFPTRASLAVAPAHYGAISSEIQTLGVWAIGYEVF